MKQIDKKTVLVNGNYFEYAIKGTRSPAIILINGAGGPIEGWMKIWSELGKENTVIAYNRMGIGNSSKPSEPQTAKVMVNDLNKLLVRLKIEPPYLIVGHSLGGFIAYLYTLTYPSDVCGIIFLESSTIKDVLNDSRTKRFVDSNKISEVDHVITSVNQIQQFDGFPDIPIVVIAGSKPALDWLMPKGVKETRLNHQIELADLSQQSKVIIAKNSGHFPQLTEPSLIIDEVNRLLHEKFNQ